MIKDMKNMLKKLANYYKPYKIMFFLDMLFALVVAVIALVIPLIVRHITQFISENSVKESLNLILKMGVVLFIFVVIEVLCNYYITYYGHVMGAYIERDMRNEIFGHYQKLSFAFYDNQKVGKLLSRITNDLFEITELLHHGPEDLVISLIKLFGAFAILLNINWKLAIVSLVLILFMMIYAVVFNKKMKLAFRDNRKKMADINGQIEESLAGVRVVKAFENEDKEIKKFGKSNENFVSSKKASYHNMAYYQSGMTAFTNLVMIVSLLFGAFLLSKGELVVEDLVVFLLYINVFVEPVRKLVSFTEGFQNGYSGYERFQEVLEIEPDIVDAKDAIVIKECKGEITFENVEFHYLENEESVLHNLNLKVNAGEYIAIVGTSGVGKTTLCSLIPRFYDVTEGRILLDGEDIKKIQVKSLRHQIGIVQQDVYLFAGTIMENIRYGKPEATDEEVIAAAKIANAHTFIMNLQDGYDTDIGQRGVKISGGQKQRLSIARVFLKNPKVLIFDEATSALDNESERMVQESLEKLAENRTTFVIAHRLSTIQNAKRILVLGKDGVEEDGTHEELLSKNGAYARLTRGGDVSLL